MNQHSTKKDKALRKLEENVEHHQKGQYYALWESRRRKKGTERLFEEIITKNILRVREMYIQIQEALWTRKKSKKSKLRNITIKLSKVKNINTFESRKRKIPYLKRFHQATGGVVRRILQARREWNEKIKVLNTNKQTKCQSRIL